MNMQLGKIKTWILLAVLVVCGALTCPSCSHRTSADTPPDGKVAEIAERGTILFGTAGDYRPLTFRQPDGTYWGFDIEVAKEIASQLGVALEFRKTSWPTLTPSTIHD